MSGALTGLLLIAGVGLLKNTGLGVNSELKAEVEKFNTANISGSVQSKIADATPEVLEQLARAPSFMTGILPSGLTIAGSNDVTNVPQAILEQGQSLFKPPASSAIVTQYGILDSAVSTFTSVYSAASGYAAQTFGFQGSIAQASGMKFDDLGFNFKNYNDVVSGGVTNQFKIEGVPAMAKELADLGTLFDTTDLAKMADPVVLVNNLLDQGLGYVGGLQTMIDDRQLDLSDTYPDDAVREELVDIMSQITGSDIDEIFATTEFNPAHRENINSLADVLDIKNLFSDEALVALGANPSLDSLANKMSNIGGKFTNTTSIGTFFSSLDLKSFPTLAGLTSLLPAGLTDGLGSILGKGTGVFGNPTVSDMTSSASGVGYLDNLKAINNLQSQLLEFDEDVYAFKSYLDGTGELDPYELSNLIDAILYKPGLASTIEDGDSKMLKCVERLDIEKSNLSAAGITPGASISNNGGLMNFGASLHGLGVDPMNLGLGSQLAGMAQAGLTGEAISASLIEGKNLGKLAVFGIDPGTKMDPMAYAKSLKNMA